MKYVEILKKNKTITVIPLKVGEFLETKKGELVQIIKGKAVAVLAKGEWGYLEEPKQKKIQKPIPSFMKPLIPSKELAAIVGSDPLVRTEVVKKLWAFIKKNGLQDTVNRRNINVGDNPLTKAIFQRKQISMFEMTKALMRHLK